MLATPEPIVALVKPAQPWNTFEPILVTEVGIVIFFNPMLYVNILPPRDFNKLGIVTLVKPVLLKAYSPMLVTVLGIIMLDKVLHSLNVLEPIVLSVELRTTLVKPLHCENALFPMVVTLSGIVTLFKAVRLENALLAMLVTLYVTPFTTKLDKIVIAPETEDDTPTEATPVPTVYVYFTLFSM